MVGHFKEPENGDYDIFDLIYISTAYKYDVNRIIRTVSSLIKSTLITALSVIKPLIVYERSIVIVTWSVYKTGVKNSSQTWLLA